MRWLREKRWDILDKVAYIDHYKMGNGFYIEESAKKPKQPCPFLENNLCSIYKTRPKACVDFPRGHTIWLECPAWTEIGHPIFKDKKVMEDQKGDFRLAEENKFLLLHLLHLARLRKEGQIQAFLDGDPFETLWITDFDETEVAWTEYGDLPYLQDSDSDYIESATKKAAEGVWDFANTTHSGDTLEAVTLYLEGQGNGTDAQDVYIHDGVDWSPSPYGAVFGTSMGYIQIDLSGFLDTWGKIDAARMRIVHENAGNSCTIRRGYLYVQYSAEYAHIALERDLRHDLHINVWNQTALLASLFTLMGKTIPFLYSILMGVWDYLSFNWNLRESIGRMLSYIYTVIAIGIVERTLAILYLSKQKLWDHIPVLYSNLTKTWRESTLIHGLNSIISRSLNLVHSLFSKIWDSISIPYSKFNTIFKSFGLLYSEFISMWETISFKWDLFALVSKVVELVYHIGAYIGRNIKLVYDILAVGLIYHSLKMVYSSSTYLGKYFSIRWDLFLRALREFNFRYSLSSIVSKILVSIHGIGGIISKLLISQYNILVSTWRHFSVKWNDFNLTGRILSTVHSIGAFVSNVIQIGYSIRNVIGRGIGIVWSLLRGVWKIVPLTYSLFKNVYGGIELTYDLFNSVWRTIKLSWILISRVFKALVFTYLMGGLMTIGKVFPFVYSVVIRIWKERSISFTYSIFNTVTKTLMFSYPIKNLIERLLTISYTHSGYIYIMIPKLILAITRELGIPISWKWVNTGIRIKPE